jgi:hypothetical protein
MDEPQKHYIDQMKPIHITLLHLHGILVKEIRTAVADMERKRQQ